VGEPWRFSRLAAILQFFGAIAPRRYQLAVDQRESRPGDLDFEQNHFKFARAPSNDAPAQLLLCILRSKFFHCATEIILWGERQAEC